MPATETFRFYGYTLRPATEADWLLAEEWSNADRYHVDAGNPMFWLDQSPQCESYLLLDRRGPIFFFKMQRTPDSHIIEFHIQFPPPARFVRKNHRVMVGLMYGMEFLESMLPNSGITTVFFSSRSSNLIRYCVDRLGFVQNGERLTKTIARSAEDVRSISDRDGASARAS